MEIERKKLPKETLDQQKRICEVRWGDQHHVGTSS
jgi:hypothetical protein